MPVEMNNWSDEIEEICDKLRINCVNLSEYHRKRYYHFKSYGKWFRLPMIILASVNSTASVGLQPVLDQTIISGITCLIGMVMGIIGSLELYLGIQTSMEMELKHSKDYYTLAIHIFKTLSLYRENRLEDGKEYLNEKYSQYIKFCESSNLLDRKMKNDLLTTVPNSASGFESDSASSNQLPKLHDLSTTDIINHEKIEKMKVEENIQNFEIEQKLNNETNNLTEIISKNTEKIQKHVQEKIDNISKVIEDDIETAALIDPSNNINV